MWRIDNISIRLSMNLEVIDIKFQVTTSSTRSNFPSRANSMILSFLTNYYIFNRMTSKLMVLAVF